MGGYLSKSQEKPRQVAVSKDVQKIQKRLNLFKKVTRLVVATLNYSETLNSPYQFFGAIQASILHQISKNMETLFQKYKFNSKDHQKVNEEEKEKEKYYIGKIDTLIRKGRYSIMFNPKVGINQNQFMTKQKIRQKWKAQFKSIKQQKIKQQNIKQNQNKNKLTTQFNFSLQQQQNMLNFDLLMYHAILKYVLSFQIPKLIPNVDTSITSIKSIDDATEFNKPEYKNYQIADKYVKFIQPFYQFSYLDENYKLKKMIESFSIVSADVFFFQDYSPLFLSQLQKTGEYFINYNLKGKSMIIGRKDSFKECHYKSDRSTSKHDLFMEKGWYDWPQKTVIMILDNFVLVGFHLSSKDENNEADLFKLLNSLCVLKQKIQQFDDKYEIIAGGDKKQKKNDFEVGKKDYKKIQRIILQCVSTIVNQGQLEKIRNTFSMFPNKPEQVTSIKMRTYAQCQYKKSYQFENISKDKIISTLTFDTQRSRIQFINGKEQQKQQQNSDIHQQKNKLVSQLIIRAISHGKKNKLQTTITVDEIKQYTSKCLPTDFHPFDHLIVVTDLKLNKKNPQDQNVKTGKSINKKQ